jgi:serine/threonine-protein kinase
LRSRGQLAIDRAIIIAHDVALGLGAAHRRGIVHRDVKPQNVLVGKDGSIKLTDFGIASVYKDINAERLTTTGMTLGTVQYYAPEQAQGEIVSPAADVYALGIVMYEMLTGHTPFDGDTPVAVAMQHIQDVPIPPSQLNPNIPLALEDIIMRCLEKVPEMRYRDGSTLARELEQLGEEEMGENIPTSNGNPKLMNSGPQNPIPPRPNGSRGPIPPTISSPNNMMPSPPTSSPQNGAQEQGMNGADGFNGFNAGPRSNPDINSSPTIAGRNSTPGFEQNQGYYSPAPIDSGTTRPFQRGTTPRSGVVQDQRDSRFASIITALILLATLLLLGFSIYLAGVLGFIPNVPWATATPTPPSGLVTVPSFIGKTYSNANKLATDNKLKLNVEGTQSAQSAECVTRQNPDPGAQTPPGSFISVSLGACPATPTTKVPNGLVGQPLSKVEGILQQTNIHFSVQSAGPDATLGSDIVKDVSPPSGSPVQSHGVILYVANCSATNCPATPTAIPGKTPTVGRTPTPSPTTAPTPTPTPGMTPTPTSGTTPTPTPGTTPTSGITPTPTH